MQNPLFQDDPSIHFTQKSFVKYSGRTEEGYLSPFVVSVRRNKVKANVSNHCEVRSFMRRMGQAISLCFFECQCNDEGSTEPGMMEVHRHISLKE